MRLTQSGRDLRPKDVPAKLTLSEVQKHNSKDDAWMILGGKVRLLLVVAWVYAKF